jgi:hypothetical protein
LAWAGITCEGVSIKYVKSCARVINQAGQPLGNAPAALVGNNRTLEARQPREGEVEAAKLQ